MKILYIEDELAKNIPRIVRLFSKYLSAEQIKTLNALEADESGYGAGPEKIKNIVEKSEVVEVEYRFPEALYKVTQKSEEYTFFLVDRNLSQHQYALEEVQKIDGTYNPILYERYTEREGDYLLQKLVLFSNREVTTSFYFLTANPAKDELRSAKDIEQQLIDFGKFKKENFIEKGNEDDFEKLRQIIEATKCLVIQYYEKALAYYSVHDPEAALWMARKTVEAICRKIFEQHISSNTNNTTKLDKYIELLSKENILPQYIIIPLRTIQYYGNYGTHAQGDDSIALTNEYAEPCIQALKTIIKWYRTDYLRKGTTT